LGVKAVIMAGGEGVRLRPLTVNRPKPMVPVANKPLLEYMVLLLKKYGFNEIGVTLHYLPSTIMDYFGDGSRWGVKLYYSIEKEKPLGTAGGVKYLVEQLGWDNDTLLVVSGDLLTDIDLGVLLKYHRSRDSVFTMALRKVDDPTRYGIALVDGDGRITRFMEKPGWAQVFSDLANMGIYVVEPEALKKIPGDREYDFAKNLIPDLINSDGRVYGYRADNYYWSDIGDLDQYKKANYDVLTKKLKLPISHLGREIKPGIYVGEDVEIDPSAVIEAPAVIGSGTRIKRNTRVSSYTFIGSHNIIEENVAIDNSIIWSYNYIGHSTRITRAIVADHVYIGDHVNIMEDAVIGDETRIKRGVIVKPGVKIWPSKIIDPYTVVSVNIKWGIRWYKTLVGPWGITGLSNIEISPELAARIGMAIASIIPRDSWIAVACDTHVSSQVIKHGVIAGVLSTGVNVADLGITPLPVLTTYTRHRGYELAVMVNTLAYDPSRVRVKIYDRNGFFLSRDKIVMIENTFFRETYRRVIGEESGEIEYPSGYIDQYIDTITKYLDMESIANTSFLIDCIYGASSKVWARLIDRYDFNVYQANCGAMGALRISSEPIIRQSIDSASRIVQSLRLDAGFIYDSDGDKVIVIDDKGRIVGGEHLALITSKILLERKGGGEIILPHSTPKNIVDMIIKYGGRVVFAEHGLIDLSRHVTPETLLVVDDRGGLTYPWVHGGSDAIITTLLILEHIGKSSEKLSEIIDRLPTTYMVKKTYRVPFEKRGLFMRMIYEELREKEVDTLDGIKIIEENLGWGYIKLVPNEPLLEIIAGSDTRDKAEKLGKMIEDIVNRILSRINT